MTKSMCITYVVDGALYVNMTNRCSNRCDFCIRNNGDGAYGSDSLWLVREPTVGEILDSIFSRDLSAYSELVFCGYGEPTCRLDDMLAVAAEVRAKFPGMRIRLNTNGHSDLINGRETAADFHGLFDVISISLNSPTPEGYDSVCHSVYGERAHAALLKFASDVKKYVPTVALSVVREFISEDDIAASRRLADSVGVTLRIRDYIPPET